MANAANLINFGTAGGTLAVGDMLYSAYSLSAPSYLPLNNDTASYLTSSYPTLGAIFAPTTVAYSAASNNVPFFNPNFSYSAIFGNKTYYLTASSGTVLASTNLSTWISRSIPSKNVVYGSSSSSNVAWASFAYGNSRLVAIRNASGATVPNGAFADNTAAVTTDGGQNWAFGALPSNVTGTGTNIGWASVAYGNGIFMAVGSGNGGGSQTYISRSVGGVEWTSAIAGPNPGFNPGQIVYGNGIWAYTYSNTGSWTVSYSTNTGVSWTTITPFATTATSIAYGNGVFVVVGSSSTGTATTTCYSSPTCVTWTARTLPSSQIWTSVTYANGYFVAIGDSATAIATSADGITWVAQTVPSASSKGLIAGGNGKFFYQQDVGSTTGANITAINFSQSSTSFTLPIASGGPLGTQAYIKAT